MYGGRSPDTTLRSPGLRGGRPYGGGLSQRTTSTEGGEHPVLSGPLAMQGIGANPTAGARLAAAHVNTEAHRERASLADGVGEDAKGGWGGLAAEGSASAVAGGAAPPYVSAFGSLPAQLAGSSPQLARVLQTHAPYMSKLESIASSATRWAGAEPGTSDARPWRARQRPVPVLPSTSSRLPSPLAPCRTAEKINAGLIIVMVQVGGRPSRCALERVIAAERMPCCSRPAAAQHPLSCLPGACPCCIRLGAP